LEVGRDGRAIRRPDARQVAAVLAMRGDLPRVEGVAGPEDDVLAAVSREDRRERGAPRSRLQDRDRHAPPTRGSTPRMIRAMFGRWRMKATEPPKRMDASAAQVTSR